MNGFAFLVGGVLPYFAVLVFVLGMSYRLRVWYRTPQPAKLKLYGPSETTTARAVLAEALFFPSLFKGDRALWAMSWFFHATLALVFVGHFRVVTGVIDHSLLSLGMSERAIGQMSAGAGGGAGIVLVVTGLLLLGRRLTTPRVREVSGLPDFFALLLLLAIFATGDLMRLGAHVDLAETRRWAASLLVFSPVVPEHGLFLVHAGLALVLFMYIPFSKILHLGGIFFTQALVKRS
ncbi:MAG: respiratory nitrate reductase subunit gamma [Deltaproteobacteria bacterium]|nr:respiratory nitrate reductase subunit gamma [Deltaproteobacteria bacterium]